MDKKACIFDEHWTTVEIKPPRWEVDLGSHVERSEDHSEGLFQPTKVLGFWQVYHINLKDALVLPPSGNQELSKPWGMFKCYGRPQHDIAVSLGSFVGALECNVINQAP